MSEENFDLYADLDEALIAPLQEEVEKKAAEERAKLKSDELYRQQTEKKIEELKTSNFQLKKNMSLLLATAKSEIERKDRQIKDIRREMDEIIFRKTKVAPKKTSENWTQTEKVEFVDGNKHHSSSRSETKIRHNDSKEPSKRKDDYKKKSPEKKIKHDSSSKTSSRDEKHSSRSKDRDERDKRDKKSSRESTRSPDRRDHKERDRNKPKETVREDDLRKVLLKNKRERSRSRDRKTSKTERRDKSSKENHRHDKKSEDKSKSKSGRDNVKSDDKKREEKAVNFEGNKSEPLSTSIKTTENPVTEQQKVPREPIEKIETKTDQLTSNLNLSADSDCDVPKEAVVEPTVTVDKTNDGVSHVISETVETAKEEEGVKEPASSLQTVPEKEKELKIEQEIPKSEEAKPDCEASSAQNGEKSIELKQGIIPGIENKANLSTESPNDSFESTKENSLDNSVEARKHKKRKIVTTEVESDGTVVWTITRKKRKT